MYLQRVKTTYTSSTVPYLNRLIYTCSDYCLLFDSDTGHEVVVNVQQLLGAAPRGQIPAPQRLVVAHRDQEPTHRVEA